MKYNTKDIEKYILRGYKPKKKRSVEKNLLHTGHWLCFWAIVVWGVYHVYAILGTPSMRILPTNVSIVLLMPLAVLGSIKLCKFGLDRSVRKQQNESPYIFIFSIIGATGGMLFARIFLSNASETTDIIIFSVLMALGVLTLIFIGCGFYYKVYLIRKYCPYLKNRY